MEPKTAKRLLMGLGVLLLIGIAYWWYNSKKTPSDTEQPPPRPAGSLGNPPRPSSTGDVPIPFLAGQDVYLNPSEPQGVMGNNDRQGIPVYSYPYSDTNAYLIGLISPTAYAGKPVGKFVSSAPRGFSKISLKSIYIWHNTPPVYPYDYVADGDYFIKTSALQKNPY